MATKRKSPSQPLGDTKPRWISVDLTEDQRKDMKSRLSDPNEVFDWLERLIQGGYKVSQQWDNYGNCHSCYVFPVGDEHANAGHILSNRAASAVGALRGALYRHYVIFEENWGNREAQTIDE